jgi:L,D-transpeptidase catalytic domain
MLDLLFRGFWRDPVGVVGRLGVGVWVVGLVSCGSMNPSREVVVSVKQQRLALMEGGEPVKVYPCSTSKFCVGDRPGSYGTPLGKLAVAQKIGAGAPPGAVFKHRRPTGEILHPNAPGRDPIVTRILWLRGQQSQNRGAYGRYIYIHGTPEEWSIGHPASYGCIRMRSMDVIDLFNRVPEGTQVRIRKAALPASAKTFAVAPPPAVPVAAPGHPDYHQATNGRVASSQGQGGPSVH